MHDDDYVRTLHAVLTHPEPTGIDPADPYGQADDGIDRYDGFGRDVLVESIRVVDGVHGPELEVSFALMLPAGPLWAGVPARGTVTVPFDDEWRRLSGYSEPGAYAPEVARRVERGARDHVVRHRRGAAGEQRTSARPFLPDRAAQWQLLLDALGAVGEVVKAEAGRVALRLDGVGDAPVAVTVVVTPEEWEEVLSRSVGGDGRRYVVELFGARDEDEHFVVFDDGDLVPSTRQQRPPVRGTAHAREPAAYLAAHPGAGLEWYAYPPEPPNPACREDDS